MNRIHLALLWHMHQPQYRDPETRKYVLPWTRLHATKDYWGMIKLFEEFPSFHATFNMVPSLCMQLEEYAGGQFSEPWLDLVFKNADIRTPFQRAEPPPARRWRAAVTGGKLDRWRVHRPSAGKPGNGIHRNPARAGDRIGTAPASSSYR